MDAHTKNTPLIERLYDIRASVRAALRDADAVTEKLAGSEDVNCAATPERVQDSVNSLIDDISYGVQHLQKIIQEHHGLIGAFAPSPVQARARA